MPVVIQAGCFKQVTAGGALDVRPFNPSAGPPHAVVASQVINKSMAGIVKSLDSALKANNLEKVAATMDQVG